VASDEQIDESLDVLEHVCAEQLGATAEVAPAAH
jgi:hypothetical protein